MSEAIDDPAAGEYGTGGGGGGLDVEFAVGPAGFSLNGGDGAESSEQAKMPSEDRSGRKPRLTTDDKRFHSTNKRNESRGSKNESTSSDKTQPSLLGRLRG